MWEIPEPHKGDIMSAYKYIKLNFRKSYKGEEEFKEYLRQRIIEWRKQDTIVRIAKPTNPIRARELGYKAKQGFVIIRAKVRKGNAHKTRFNKGRRPSKMGINQVKRKISNQVIAEQRAARKYRNLEVLNSYYVGEDGQHVWYEVIMVDPYHPRIQSDKNIAWIINHKGRAFRGLTSTGRKMRGLLNKGRGAEKLRPSIRAHNRKGK